MLARLRFNAGEGAYVEGEFAAVEVVPKRRNKGALCDLHLRVIACRLAADAPAEALAGARKACLEASFDPNPNVRFAARHLRDSLEEVERVGPGDIEGLRVGLYLKSERGDEISTERLTDREGGAWFLDVSPAADCRLRLEESDKPQRSEGGSKLKVLATKSPLFFSAHEPPPSADRLRRPTIYYERAKEPSPGEQESLPLAAEPWPEPPSQAEGGSEPRVFHLSDRRVIAVLEEVVGGGAVLTFVTQSPELSGATARFECGGERGEVTLESAETDGAWSGQRKLRCSFKELAAEVPTFVLIPAQPEE